MRFVCDLEISTRVYNEFKEWYPKTYPDFTGTIHRSAKELGVAEIIDEEHGLREYRFMRI